MSKEQGWELRSVVYSAPLGVEGEGDRKASSPPCYVLLALKGVGKRRKQVAVAVLLFMITKKEWVEPASKYNQERSTEGSLSLIIYSQALSNLIRGRK